LKNNPEVAAFRDHMMKQVKQKGSWDNNDGFDNKWNTGGRKDDNYDSKLKNKDNFKKENNY